MKRPSRSKTRKVLFSSTPDNHPPGAHQLNRLGAKEVTLLLIILAMVANFVLSIVIEVEKRAALAGDGAGIACFTSNQGGCYGVQTSSYASTLGISNPLIGIVIFPLIILGLGVLARHEIWRRKASYLPAFALGLITLALSAGALFSGYLLYVQAVILQEYCIYCVYVDCIMILSTIAFFIVMYPEMDELLE